MTGMHSNTDTFKLTVCLVLALLFRFAAAEAQVASPASADVFAQVREGMSSNEVKALLGAPIYERKREGATYSFAWVYCCIPHGAHQTEPNRHPHFWIEFSKDEETVQRRMRFSDVERGDFPWHNRDVIEYVVEHIAKLNASDKVCLKPIPVWLAEIGRNRPEEFKPLCEVEVTLDELAQDHVPVLITEHGRPAAYLVDVDSFELQQDKLRILEGIARGERAIEEGRVLTEEQAETRVTRWLN